MEFGAEYQFKSKQMQTNKEIDTDTIYNVDRITVKRVSYVN